MKTEKEIKKRIYELKEEKGPLRDSYIRAIDKEQQDFYAAEIVRYDFMIFELQWVLK